MTYITAAQKQDKFEHITNATNATGLGPPRNWQNMSKVWQDLKSTIKSGLNVDCKMFKKLTPGQ